jgi:hypothetical protein
MAPKGAFNVFVTKRNSELMKIDRTLVTISPLRVVTSGKPDAILKIKPIERLVPVSFLHYCNSTPGLST